MEDRKTREAKLGNPHLNSALLTMRFELSGSFQREPRAAGGSRIAHSWFGDDTVRAFLTRFLWPLLSRSIIW